MFKTYTKFVDDKERMFAAVDLGTNELIEECNVLEIFRALPEDKDLVPWPLTKFDMSSSLEANGVVNIERLFQFCSLDGDGMKYSASIRDPNVFIIPNIEGKKMKFVAAYPIAKDSELVYTLSPEFLDSVSIF